MEKLVVIRSLSQLDELREYIKNSDYIAFDTETTGVTKEAKIIGFSVSADSDTGYYVILSEWNKDAQALIDLETKDAAHDIIESLAHKNLVMHNAVFDCWVVENNYKISLIKAVHTDTMILAHLLDENRTNGLKELAVSIFGEESKEEQRIMKESVLANGGSLTRDKYELFKADSTLIAEYGAKDAILTIKLFYHFVNELYAQGLDKFFYEDESMPLLRGPTYQLNTTGLKVDTERLVRLKGELEADCMELKAQIYNEITPLVKAEYPGTRKGNTFNIGSTKQLSWLLFIKLGNDFSALTKEGRNLCKALGLKLPYNAKARREFLQTIIHYKDRVWQQAEFNPKTKKMGRPKKVSPVWNYIAADRATLVKFSQRYKWVDALMKYNKNMKLLNTYVMGIQERMQYGIIRPSFLQHGTTSGRYSSKNPNFQNLPRDDKRIKECIVARQGKVFVGADYSQLEPRVFASFSGDERLLKCFKSGDDFYSVIGAEVFDKYDCSLKKDDENSFANKYKHLRNLSKVIALSSAYGTTAAKMAPATGKTIDEAQEIIDNYFERFPNVKRLMLESHELAMKHGKVENLFGRPRRMPKAMDIPKIYKKVKHEDLPYEARNVLNLAINHRIQSTGASIMNRAAIAVCEMVTRVSHVDSRWTEVKIVLQVHDELVLEGPEELAEDMLTVLKHAMETTVTLPGVDLVAEPKSAKILSDLK